MIGTTISCKMIPGIAPVTAPPINAAIPNLVVSNPMQHSIANPHIRRPITMALTNDTYTYAFLFGNFPCNHPATNPYAANSNAIQKAVGNIGGIPSVKERRRGATNPTSSPQGAPQKNPHKSTGMCIGQSILPICGICPVKNGITNAKAKNMADKVIFLILFLLILLLTAIEKGALFPTGKSNTFLVLSLRLLYFK